MFKIFLDRFSAYFVSKILKQNANYALTRLQLILLSGKGREYKSVNESILYLYSYVFINV